MSMKRNTSSKRANKKKTRLNHIVFISCVSNSNFTLSQIEKFLTVIYNKKYFQIGKLNKNYNSQKF